MNITFKVDSNSKGKYKQILVRFYKSKTIDYSVGTEIYVKHEHWNFEKKQLKKVPSFKNYVSISKKLLKIELTIYEAYQIDFISGVPINSTWLRSIVLNVFNRSKQEIEKKKENKDIYFYDWAVNWIKNATNMYRKKNEKVFNDDDNQAYSSAIDKIRRFEKYTGKKYKFSDYNKDLKIEYKKFLLEQDKMSAATINTILVKCSYLQKKAINSGIEMNKEWNEVNNNVVDHKDIDLIYLDEREINDLYQLDLSIEKDEYLDIARDNYIIGLRTGLRVSDYLIGLNEDNLKTGQILIKTKKTKTKVVIPIHPQVREILYKWRGLPPKISENVFNQKIKQVAKLARIDEKVDGGIIQNIVLWDETKTRRKIFGIYEKWKLVVSHTARRSFATNLYLQGVDNQIIMQVGGWATEEQMLHYVKQFGNRASKVIAKNWNIKIEPIDFEKLRKTT
ncbi:tyrosine-type recombinase/integrase [Aquimarina longa]|uniref:tyrosine-type recombinase/integrase n=1 Tax=Aquimarina longa TaxID=1080221 RepID=UPI00078089BA|nr:tyrosine-type recombinase/integrase [Aquimarina longa]